MKELYYEDDVVNYGTIQRYSEIHNKNKANVKTIK